MSIEGPFGGPKPEKTKRVLASRLNIGDIVIENGVPTEIVGKRRSGTGVTFELASGEHMNVDDDDTEGVEVP